MQALVDSVTTGAAVAVSGEIADDMLMVTPSASSLDVTKDKTTVFQVCFTDPTMGASAAKFLAEKYADAKIALFYNSGDTYSSGVADAFAEQAKASKLDIVDTETFKDDSSTSFINQPTKAMRKIKIEGLTGELTWNDEGQVEKPATAYVIQDGKYIAA